MPDDDLTHVDDDEATVFEPNPWGARQRVIPRAGFVPAPVRAKGTPPPLPVVASPVVAAPIAAPPRWPTLRTIETIVPLPVAFAPPPVVAMPPRPRRQTFLLSRYGAPLYLAGVVMCLLVAYVAKPSSRAHSAVPAAALTAVAQPEMVVTPIPVVEAPAPVVPVVEPVVEPEPEVVKPVKRTTPRVQKVAKPAIASRTTKRRAIKIDAADTASPLGRMRPHGY